MTFKNLILVLVLLQFTITYSYSEDSIPLPIYPSGYTKIKIASSSASEYRNQGTSTKYSPEKSYDNNLDTEYHSIKDNTTFPLTLIYNFEKASSIDKIDYYPRTDVIDIDGHWIELEIKVHYENNSSEIVFNNFGNGFTEFNRAYSPEEKFYHTIELSKTYHDVKGIEFVFYSGQKNMITVSEIVFWEPSESKFDPSTFFSDEFYLNLRDDVSLDKINAINDNDYFKTYALDLFYKRYNKEFRFQKFKPYPKPSNISNNLRIYTQSICSNVTGIYLEKGDEIFVVSDQEVQLLQIDYWPHDKDNINLFDASVNPHQEQRTFYSLKKGINLIKAEQNGLFYVQYWSDQYLTDPELGLHFMYGKINGYFDGRTKSREDWSKLLNLAKYPYYDVIGQYVQITFPLIGFKEITDNGKDLIDLYDELNYSARFIQGHINIPGSEIPNHSHVIGVYKKYKYAGPEGVFYNISDINNSWENKPTLEKNFNYSLLKDDFYGTVHEWGHTFQIRQELNWGNLTEVTCNIASDYVWVERLGHQKSKLLNPTNGFNTQYENSWNTFMVQNQSFADLTSGKGVLFWQLYLYVTKVLGNLDFYPQLHELARRNNPKLKNEDAMLNFTFLAAQSSKLNLNRYFEKWNFYKEGSFISGDYYGLDTFNITNDKIKHYKTKVTNLGFDEINDAVEYITDSNFELFKNKTKIEEGNIEVTTENITLTNWKGVVVFENYLNGILTNIYLDPIKIPKATNDTQQTIYAVQFDGYRKMVYTNVENQECNQCYCGPELVITNNKVLDDYKSNPLNNSLPIPNSLINRNWIGTTTTASIEDIEYNFSQARISDPSVYNQFKTFAFLNEFKVENCPIGIDSCDAIDKTHKWFSLNSQQKALYILNSERVARGLPPFEGISTEVAKIAQLYSDYLAQLNNGLNHNLTLNINNKLTTNPWERLNSLSEIQNNTEFYGFAENLAYLANKPNKCNIPIELAIYNWIYNDSGSNWGHRNFIFSLLNDNSGNEYKEGLVGFGISNIIENDGWIKFYIVMNAVDPVNTFDFNATIINCNSNSITLDYNQIVNDKEKVILNPLTNIIYFGTTDAVEVEIYNINGSLIYHSIIQNGILTTEKLNPGYFILRLKNNGKYSIFKLIKTS